MNPDSKKKKIFIGAILLVVLAGGFLIYFSWFTAPPALVSLPTFSASFSMDIFNNPKFTQLKIFGDLPVKLGIPQGSPDPFTKPVLLN